MKYYKFFLLPLCSYLLLLSCGPMDETYSKFWGDEAKTYPTKADSVKVFPGNNRLEMTWQLRGTPTITNARIYWNNRSEYADFPITLTGAIVDTVKVLLDDMTENTFSFDIYTFDAKNNHSIPVSTTGRVYGEIYRLTLLSRIVTNAERNQGNTTVTWGNRVDLTSIGTELSYRTTSGATKTLFEAPDVASTVLADMDYANQKTFRHRSAYLPEETAIDTFYTDWVTTTVKGEPVELPKTGWTATASSSDSRYTTDRQPEHIIEGTVNTLWINDVPNALYNFYPHWVRVDMGEVKNDIYGFTIDYTVRAEAPKQIEFWYSLDDVTYISAGIYELPYTAGNHFVDFNNPLKSFRYFRFDFKTGNGSGNCAVREVGVFRRS